MLAASLTQGGGRIMHRYGNRVLLAEVPPGAEARLADEGNASFAGESAMPDDLTETEKLGVQAFELRQSAKYAREKAERPHQGESWEGPEGVHPLNCMDVGIDSGADTQMPGALAADAGAPALSARLTGKVAVAIIIIDGPSAALQFSAAERAKVVAEVQNGLGWLGAQNAAGAVSFSYEIYTPTITATPLTGTPTGAQMEDRFRNPAMAGLGYGTGLANVTKFANDMRSRLGTNWAYVGFFVKYPVRHFAYASIGGPRIIMQYANDGWGPDNIDRVFAHETGHIFGAPDEYTASGCSCGGSWGYYGRPNSNCESCASGGGVKCLMRSNDWEMCSVTPYHLGFPLADQRYSGVFRAGTGRYALWLNASYESFVAKWQQWAGTGLRLVDLDIVVVGGERRYNGVWTAGTDAYGLWLNADWNAFVAKWQQWSSQGLRLVCMETVRVGNQNLYSGVFRAGTGGYGLWGNATWASFTAKWQEWAQQNLRLVDITITNFGNDRRYSGVFRSGTDGYGLWVNSEWAQFEAKWQEWSRQNLRLIDMEITSFGGQRQYSGVFRSGADAYGLWVNANYSSFQAKWQEWSGQGLRLTDVEVTDPANTVNAPTKSGAIAAALGVQADENGGDGYGGIFSTDSSLQGEDMNTGMMIAGAPVSKSTSESENGGFGGMSGGDQVQPVPKTTNASATANADSGFDAEAFGGFGGLGGASHAPGGNDGADNPSGGEDGMGGTGGGVEGGGADLDTGGTGGM